MIILDTDHLTVLRYSEHRSYSTLSRRLIVAGGNPITTTIINVEEQMRGWLAEIHRHQPFLAQRLAYERLQDMIDFFADWMVLRVDFPSIAIHDQLKSHRLRIGSQDLKIASIALANGALLLSANLVEFQRVPGLRVEDWLVDEEDRE